MSDKLVFAGTPSFAVESLHALVRIGRAPAMVLTQPDRPAGRGRKTIPGAVKRAAEALQLPIYQPERLATPEVLDKLTALAPLAIVVAAYGRIFPPALLDLPARGCINVHASLLPRWRGAAPVQAAILAGDRETGISLMHMEQGLDTGGVYSSEALEIDAGETAGMLQERLALLGGRLLARRLPEILEGSLAPLPQDERLATFAGRILSDDARLDWRSPALYLSRCVRAYNPAPGAWFMLEGERVKCWSARPLAADDPDAPRHAGTRGPGAILGLRGSDDNGLDIVCGEGVLRLLVLQRPGRGRVSAAEFSRQRPLPTSLAL